MPELPWQKADERIRLRGVGILEWIYDHKGPSDKVCNDKDTALLRSSMGIILCHPELLVEDAFLELTSVLSVGVVGFLNNRNMVTMLSHQEQSGTVI